MLPSTAVADCRKGDIDIIYTKSVSRFGRDTVDALSAYNEIHPLGVRLVFQQEGIDSDNLDASTMISIYSSLAQSENESRRDNISLGIKFRAMSGTSKIYSKKCYGYDHDKDGNLVIKEPEASAVRLIYESYLAGYSIQGLRKLLLEKSIDSPTGKILWCKQSIEMILRNNTQVIRKYLIRGIIPAVEIIIAFMIITLPSLAEICLMLYRWNKLPAAM